MHESFGVTVERAALLYVAFGGSSTPWYVLVPFPMDMRRKALLKGSMVDEEELDIRLRSREISPRL